MTGARHESGAIVSEAPIDRPPTRNNWTVPDHFAEREERLEPSGAQNRGASRYPLGPDPVHEALSSEVTLG